MRVNVYAEEMTDRVEIVSKTIDGHEFTGLRFYLELPASTYSHAVGQKVPADIDPRLFDGVIQIQGPFIHHPGDDDSAAVTFWGKQDLRPMLTRALALLAEHYNNDDSKG